MTRKVLVDADPGVADAVALCLALTDPELELVAVTATGGNVSPEQSTRNVQAIVEQIDPPRLPRIGAADPEQPLRALGCGLSGPDGLWGAGLRVAELHHRHPSAKVIAEEIRAASEELTILACGPLSNLATVFQREPDWATQVGHLMIVGGTYAGPGNVTPAAEFNIYCDAEAARRVFQSPVTKTLLPLDVSSRVVLDYSAVDRLSNTTTSAGSLLGKILPKAYWAFHERLGVEGIYLPEAVAVVAASHPELFTTEPLYCDIELAGDLTYGATVLDRRRSTMSRANMDVITDLEVDAVTQKIIEGLQAAC